MKKLGLVVILLLSFSVIAVAQDVPATEVFGGYSFFRCDVDSPASCNLNGWNAGVSFNINQNWSGVVDVSGHYGYVDNFSPAFTWYDLKSHNFLFGPRYTFRSGKVAPFAQALFGINHVNPEPDYAASTQNNFAMAFGGGVDYAISDKLSVRPAQLDYVVVRNASMNGRLNSSDYSNDFRFSAGIVFKFGKR